MKRVNGVGPQKRLRINIKEIDVSRETDQTLWAMVIVVFAFSAVIAILGSWKKDIIHEIQEAQIDITEFDIEEIYEEELPPLQGEVNE